MFQAVTYKVLLVITGLLALVWLAGETHFFFAKPDIADREQLIEQALSGAQKDFRSKEEELIRNSERLRNSIQPILSRDLDPKRISNLLDNHSGFWGITLFRDRQQFVWSGIPVMYMPDLNPDPVYVTLQQSGYVLYFVSQKIIYADDGTRFDLVTTRLIRRSGASPQLLTDQIDETEKWAQNQVYPVNFKFFDFDLPQVPARQAALSTVSVDSVGFVTATTADFQALERDWERNMARFRYLMISIAFVLMLMFLVRRLYEFTPASAALAIGGVIGAVWMMSIWIGTPVPRLMHPDTGIRTLLLSALFRDALFASLIVFCLARYLQHHRKFQNKISDFFHNGVFAAISGVFAVWCMNRIHSTILETQPGLLSLKVNPDGATWALYISTLLLAGGLIILLFLTVRFAIHARSQQLRQKLIYFCLIFVISAGGIYLLIDPSFGTGLLVSLLITSMLIILASTLEQPGWLNFKYLPVPRLISLAVFGVVVMAIPFYFDAELQKENDEMLRMSINYAGTEAGQAEEISRRLLVSLSEDPGIQQIQSVEAFPSFPIHAAAQFRRRVNQMIEPDWNSYTILAFLLDGRLNIITDFGSQPSFADRFSTSFHDEVRSFIRASLQKPFARLPIIESEPRFKGFPIFIKGLQSIPSDFPSQPSWLVTFVLVEGNTFGRPVHDALAFHHRDRDNWNKFIVTEYKNRIKSRTTAATRAPVYPVHHTLHDDFGLETGMSKIRYLDEPSPVRQLIYRHDSETHIITTVRDQTVLNFIFSSFRFLVAILILSLAFYQIVVLFSGRKKDTRQRLHDRILDSYLLATLLFLVALALVTEFIVGRQNMRIAEQELSRNLTLLENRIYQRQAGETEPGMFDPQDIDVMIYTDGRVSGTTAPEIFRLQLISEFMPFEAYDKIYNQNVSTAFQQMNIGGMPVLMGFRALFENNQVNRVVAIPAYTRSAAYEEEFLQTTSYLIAFYIIIFLFFTGGAWLLSRKLTQPLSEFQSGLKQISSGNLDTTIPVSSNDEIGELAAAYNQMVTDLKKLRAELAEVERDAAWSEMARQIAHEIKNPLTPMKLNIQHLQRQIVSGEKSMEELRPSIQKLTQLLVEQIDSLNTIASDFSRFAKPLSGNFERTNLVELITSVIELFEHQEEVDIQFERPIEPVHTYVIPDEIKRVCINLIKNSIEAMDGGGKIAIRLISDSDFVKVYFTDDGSGILNEHADRIFTPNFSTKTSGTGLGLAICRKIMEAHKGSITFRSANGAGTTFELVLPSRVHNRVES